VHARRGVYGSSSFRNAPEHWRSRYFVPEGQQYRIRDEIREMCSFHRLNLRQTDTYPDLGRWDFIFCRNVLIYLSPEAREHILSAFFNVLAPGGYLLLGHSENLLNVDTPFESLHLNNELVYRRGADTAGRGR
jgi:chemotaxis protein methyltransferase CheR